MNMAENDSDKFILTMTDPMEEGGVGLAALIKIFFNVYRS